MIDKLIEFFYKYENHHKNISREDLVKYFTKMLEIDQIIIHVEDGEILGILEYYLLNYAQFGWLICNGKIDIYEHDITKGDIAYFANGIVIPERRGKTVYKLIKKEFFNRTKDCSYIVGHKNGKRFKPIAVFKRGAKQ